MNREHDAGREYAEIWGETVEANRKLRTLAMILGGACLALAVLLLRVATVEPPRPIVVRVDEVGRAEAVAYEAATAQADPLDPTTKYFLNRFIADFYSQATGDGRGALDPEPPLPLDRAGERCVHARRRRGRRHGGRHRRHRAPGRAGRAPHPPRTGGAARRDGRFRSGPPQAGAGDPERERWSITLRFTFLTVIPSELVVYNPMGILITYLQADRALVTEQPSDDRTSRGAARRRSKPFGWTDREAEWVALVCLHSGVFTRDQISDWLGIHRRTARRFIRDILDQRLAAMDRLAGRRVCRISARAVYRALGAEDIRHRRIASAEVLVRRLLSLDYVIAHTGLPWLPTEPEKVGAFEALGIERSILPVRVYRGAAGETRRYFPLK